MTLSAQTLNAPTLNAPTLHARGLVLPPLLSGVDLDLADGELVVVTSDDEGAPSALLRVLAGAASPARGVVVGGTLLLDAPPGTGWEDGDVAGELADPAALRALGMTSPPVREMWMLSTGERQRVRIARALAAPADVALLLDEPLGGLDAAGVRAVLAALRGRTVLMAASSDPRAAAAADRVLVLADGMLRPS